MSENQANLGDPPSRRVPDGQSDSAARPAEVPGADPRPTPTPDATAQQPAVNPSSYQPGHAPVGAPQSGAQPYTGGYSYGAPHGTTTQQPYSHQWQQHPAPQPPTWSGPLAPVPPARRGGAGKIVLATVAAAVIAMGSGATGVYVGSQLNDGGNTTVQEITSTAPIVDRSSLAEIAAKLQPSVVVISTRSGEGSGVVISADGYIVTNNHVVASASGDSVDVTFNSGKKVDGEIVGTDPRTDLAVVKVSDVGELVFAKWGDSDAVQVGDTVLAIGSPLGLQGSVTAGIVSALHRTITVGDDQGQAGTTIGDAIQTDAPINPGNSGGALVNTAGEVVGINSAIATSGQGSNGNIGVGFAISSNKAKSVTEQLIKGGKVSHPYLGVSVTAAESGGALVRSVAAGSPAEQAGVKEGDVITKIDGRAVAGSEDLIGAVQGGTVGGTMELTIVRGGSEQTITATLTEAP